MIFRAAKISPAIAAHATHAARRPFKSSRAVLSFVQRSMFSVRCSMFAFGLWTLAFGPLTARSALVRIGPFVNGTTMEADTNVIKVIAISGPVANADGSFTTIGLPLRLTPSADGSITNNLAQNNWLATNAFLGTGIAFRVPLDSGGTVYSMYDLRISGYNTFVTITNGPGGTNLPTFNQLTNIFFGTPIMQSNLPALTNKFITLLEVTNAQLAAVPTNFWSSSAAAWMSNLISLGSLTTNKYIAGTLMSSSTNSAGLVTFNAVNQTNGYSPLVFTNVSQVVYTNMLTAVSNALAGQITAPTNGYSPLVFTNVSQVVYTNMLIALTNGYATTTFAKSVTNGYSTAVFTNSAQFLYTNALPGLTNGFVRSDITNNAATVAQLVSATNAIAAGSGISASIATNINNAAAGVIATNGIGLTFKFSTTGTNAITGITQPLVNAASNSVVATATNTASSLITQSNVATLALINARPIFNQVISNVYAGSNVTVTVTNLVNGERVAVLDNMSDTQFKAYFDRNVNALSADNGLGTNLELDTNSFSGNTALTVVGNQFNTGDLDLTGNSTFRGNVLVTNGVFSGNGGGLTNASSTNLMGSALTQVTNIAQFSIGVLSINATTATNIDKAQVATASNFNANANSATTNFLQAEKLNRTNDIAYSLTSTNTALEGNVSFGFTGGATNFYSTTNVLKFYNAGSREATNGTFIWNIPLGIYTNWYNGAIFTNNGSAWLLQTNGIPLYSITGSSPVGTSSAVNGALPAPVSVSSFYIDGNGMAFFGPISITNLNAISNSIVVVASNNAVANLNGNGTNTFLTNAILVWNGQPNVNAVNNGATLNFQALAAGQYNTNLASGYGAAIVSGATNYINGDGSSLIMGGTFNRIDGFSGNSDVIAGGVGNHLNANIGVGNTTANFIGAGSSNVVNLGTSFSFLGGGFRNSLAGNYAAILGGVANTNALDGSVIIGGASNYLGGMWSMAGGRNIRSTNDNVFVWSDGTPISSTINAQATIAATNGLKILVGGVTVTNLNPGAAAAALGITAAGTLTTNSVPNSIVATAIATFGVTNMSPLVGNNEYTDMRAAPHDTGRSLGVTYGSTNRAFLWVGNGAGTGSNVWGGSFSFPGGMLAAGNQYWQDLPKGDFFDDQSFYWGMGPVASSRKMAWPNGDGITNGQGSVQPGLSVVMGNPYAGIAYANFRQAFTNSAHGVLQGSDSNGVPIYVPQFGYVIGQIGDAYGNPDPVTGIVDQTGKYSQQAPSYQGLISSDYAVNYYLSLNANRSGDPSYGGQAPLFAIQTDHFLDGATNRVIAGFPQQIGGTWDVRQSTWKWALSVDESTGGTTVSSTNSLLQTGKIEAESTNTGSYVFGRLWDSPTAQTEFQGTVNFDLPSQVYGNYGAWTFDAVGTHRLGVVIISGQYPHWGHGSGSPFQIAQFSAADLSTIDVGHIPTFTNEFVINADSTVSIPFGIGSQAANSSLAVGTAGITNTLTINYRLMGFTGTSVTQTNTSTHTTFSRGTITTPSDIILQPNEAVRGSSCAAQAVQAF
jgi:hypothetical protein